VRLFGRFSSVLVGCLAGILVAWSGPASSVGSVSPTSAELNWFSVTQSVIAGSLLAGVVAIFKFATIVGHWYHTNENRLRELEEARQRHRQELDWNDMRISQVENHIADHSPEFRRRTQELILSGKLPDRRKSDNR